MAYIDAGLDFLCDVTNISLNPRQYSNFTLYCCSACVFVTPAWMFLCDESNQGFELFNCSFCEGFAEIFVSEFVLFWLLRTISLNSRQHPNFRFHCCSACLLCYITLMAYIDVCLYCFVWYKQLGLWVVQLQLLGTLCWNICQVLSFNGSWNVSLNPRQHSNIWNTDFMAAQHVCLLGDIDGIHRGPAGVFILWCA